MYKLLLIFLLPLSVLAEPTLSGRVVSIFDGDTIKILDSKKKEHKVRFAHIDTPEKKQDFGHRAKLHLSKLIFGKQVKILIKTKDLYGRNIGTVFLDDKNINLEMVKAGLAWHYKAYSKDQRFALAEEKARKQKIGLWVANKPIAPWDYRRSKKKNEK